MFQSIISEKFRGQKSSHGWLEQLTNDQFLIVAQSPNHKHLEDPHAPGWYLLVNDSENFTMT